MSGEGGAMYRQYILDHYRNPQHWGETDPADVRHEGENPLCGDVMTITLAVDGDDRITEARFKGRGCAISQASADILLGNLKGKALDEVLALDEDAVLELLGIEVTPVRQKCAMLPLIVTRDGILVHRGEREEGRSSTEDRA